MRSRLRWLAPAARRWFVILDRGGADFDELQRADVAGRYSNMPSISRLPRIIVKSVAGQKFWRGAPLHRRVILAAVLVAGAVILAGLLAGGVSGGIFGHWLQSGASAPEQIP